MTVMNTDVGTVQPQDVEKINKDQELFTKRMARLNAISCNFMEDSLNPVEAEQESRVALKALGANGGLQEMLVTQMVSIHHLHQISIAMASKASQINNRQYFTNTATKLANTSVQQANLLSRLQGSGGQKIIVERVDVHNGGQAVVGTINSK